MQVRNFLDLATGHLTTEDAALLTAGSADPDTFPFDVMVYEHGWIVSTASLIDAEFRDEKIKQLREYGMSDVFVALADRSGREGCWLLRFDREEDLDPGLPIGGYGLRGEEAETYRLGCLDGGFHAELGATNSEGSNASKGVSSGAHGDFSRCLSMPAECFETPDDVESLKRLFGVLTRHGGDIESAAKDWRHQLLERDRQRCLEANRLSPPFLVCPNWGHYFAGDSTERTVRWVLDRRSCSLIHLEILEEEAGEWRHATDTERAEVDESLVIANPGVLVDDPYEWGCVDADELPATIADAFVPDGR